MIQKANVGVGIAGQEGLQAACASDYAIGQVGNVRKMILIFGYSSMYFFIIEIILSVF